MASADRLFQKTTKAGQFDISTSMLFLTDPKYHVRIVHGLRNHFPNTMFGGVLLWTLIELLLRYMRSLYALWWQKTPLTNGHVQEAKTHCRKIGEAFRWGPFTTCLRPFWWLIFTSILFAGFSTPPPFCWEGGSSALSAPFLHPLCALCAPPVLR